SRSATAIAGKVMGELERLTELPVPRVNNIAAALDQAAEVIDRAYGKGASGILQRVTVNAGVIRGGLKVNMVASDCEFEVDIRLPVGVTAPEIIAEVEKIVTKYPEVSYKQDIYDAPSWNAPDAEMVEIVRNNARAISGIDP